LAWSTARKIKLAYFSDLNAKKANICQIPVPEERPDVFPQRVNQANACKPTIIFKPSTQRQHSPHERNILMITTWFNQIKVIELLYDAAKDKYDYS
jgi:hypothetical protein